jgi:hypothetical protein
VIPDDFEALYFYAYSLSVEGKVSAIRDFYKNPPIAPQETMDKIIDHICDHSDFRDKDRIIAFIKSSSPDLIQQYERMYQKRIKEEDQYAQVPRDVFICFSQSDIEVAYKVVEALEKDGFTCWLSSRNLRPNDSENYWINIKKAIEQAQLFLVISSQSSMISKDVQREIEIAQDYDKRMFEYKIDASAHTVLFKHVFNGVKWVDGIQDPIDGIAFLVDSIHKENYIKKTNSPRSLNSFSHSKVKNKWSLGLLLSLAIVILFTLFIYGLSNNNTLDILYLTNGDPIDDNWTNEAIWNGISSFSNNNSLKIEYFQPSEVTVDAYMKAIDEASKSGVKIIIAAGITLEEVFGLAQDQYRDIQFILLNGTPRVGPLLLTN